MSDIVPNDNSRFVLFPIKYDEIWKMYKDAEASFWTVEEVSLSDDIADWNNKLNDNERHFIKYVLAFFAASDGIVSENLALRFYGDTKMREARTFYGFQLMMEGIHSEMYSLLIDTYISNSEEKDKLFNAVENIPIIKEKAEWALKWIDSNESFAERLVAFSIVEGIFFSSSFCAIYWLKKRGLMPGLTFSNDLVSRDENLHCEFGSLLYSMEINKLPEEKIHEMFIEAINLECKFASEALPVELIGINSKMMCDYIKFVADRLLVNLGYNKLYNVQNPFDWMELLGLQSKGNFFERKISSYQKSGVGKSKEDNKITFDADF